MKTVRRIGEEVFNWLFYGHLWIAAGAAGLSWLTLHVVPPHSANWSSPVQVFFATLGVYTLHRWLSYRRANGAPDGRRYRLVSRYPMLSLTIGVVALLMAVWIGLSDLIGPLLDARLSFIDVNWWPIIIAIPLTVFYLTPPWPGGQRLRDFPYVKVVWVALSWMLVTGLYTYGNGSSGIGAWSHNPTMYSRPNDFVIIIYMTAIFCYTLAVALLFDFRDVDLDRRQGVRTVANTKPGLAKGLAAGCFVLSTLLLGLLSIRVWLPLIVTLGCCLLVVRLTSERRGEDFYAIWVNGLLVLLPGLVWLFDLLL